MAKHFFTKGINADDAPHLLDPAQLINGENIRIAPSGMLEAILGTIHRGAALPAGTNTCIGAVADEAGQYIVYFVHNSNNDHRIYLYYTANNSISTIMQGAILKFDKYSLVHSAAIVNNIVYWTDGLNEPRKINIGAAVKMNHAGVSPVASDWQFAAIGDQSEFTIIRRPPGLPPTIAKSTDPDFVGSQIANDSFQFCYQYIYWDGEASVLSPRSVSSRINDKNEIFNRVLVTMSLKEKISETVKTLRLVVKFKSTGKFFVVKQWDAVKDAAAIASHNSGTTALAFHFYNNIVGLAIDDATSATPYHSVPLKSRALAAVKNRIFLGNNTEGFDAPAGNSLSVTPVAISYDSHVAAQWFEYKYKDPTITDPNYGGVEAGRYVYYLPGAATPGWYWTTTGEQSYGIDLTYPYPPDLYSDTPPSTLTLVSLVFGGATLEQLRENIIPAGTSVGNDAASTYTELRDTGHTTDITGYGGGAGSSGSSRLQYKTGADYQFGIVFYDFALRNCGVITNDALKIHIPRRTFAIVGQNPTLGWSVSNTNAATEIPAWAAYYSIVRTMNLKTRFFMQSTVGKVEYYKKAADGTWSTTGAFTFNKDAAAIAIDTTALLQANLGYNFSEGDVCILYRSDSVSFELPIVGTDGGRILVKPVDIGSLTSNSFLYEIYTPFKPSENEPFYEVGEMYPIEGGLYSKTSGEIKGDISVLGRTYDSIGYDAEAMCANDKFYKVFDTDAGRVNLAIDSKQKKNKTSVRFSNVYVPGTDTNGLSAFEALNEEILPLEMGSVQKLISGSKSQTDGSVLLAIGEAETASCYIGEAQLSDNAGNTFLVRSVGVIGQVNILQGSLGTQNPESVQSYKGRVFWYDIANGVVGSYSANGLFPISAYKLQTALQKFTEKYRTTTIAGAGTQRPFIYGGIDPYYGEYLVSVPQTESEAPAGTLVDPDIDNPYDFYDGKAKVWVYKIEKDIWMPSHTYTPEAFVPLGNKFYSFKAGVMYEHGNKTAALNNFYGTVVDSKIMFVSNGEGNDKVNIFRNISLEANRKPVYTHIRTEYPNIQSSDLVDEWQLKEGIFYAPIMNDRLSPNTAGDGNFKMQFGDPMRGQWAKVMMQFSGSEGLLQIRFVNVICRPSSGHTNI